jgi:ABC-type maltose transport system permease subunit
MPTLARCCNSRHHNIAATFDGALARGIIAAVIAPLFGDLLILAAIIKLVATYGDRTL